MQDAREGQGKSVVKERDRKTNPWTRGTPTPRVGDKIVSQAEV